MPPTQPGAEDPDADDRRGTAADVGGSAVEGAGTSGGCGSCDGCDGPDCGCDFLLFLRLSTVLLLVAAVLPGVGADRIVAALIRGYRRWLTRFTPACPGTPSCSDYALTAVRRRGARHGLRLAADRIAHCRVIASSVHPDTAGGT